MRLPWLVLLIAAYVVLDVANPLMPGALMFGLEDSVEARQADRLRVHHDSALLPRATAPVAVVVAQRAVILCRAPAPAPSPVFRAQTARSAPVCPAPPTSPEDH
jgi:hypothetical protein